ncbi:DUF6755 family protein [Xanthovirga aplysinae]|uniref:DUF6755 family protein n=1 Tax=Xanthovirga aplysinae TaxID=2529853 RepID=UPI0012BCB452|nr:DUF6755 family protein [Xanthovirga aplysinae]MTI31726.1 hypothetical protein [Xanthovirga aplysinae]
MSDFREAQNQAHPNKTNTLMVGIIFLLIGIVGIQIWLLYGTLNNALSENQGFALAAAIGSFVFFFLALFLLKYLPDARGKSRRN